MADMFRLDGKVAVVIGAGSGIGEAAATGLARQGASVVCADVRLDAAQRVAKEIGGGAVELDIVNHERTRAVLRQIVEDLGALDIAVSTPGINVRKPILEYSS